MKKVIKTSALCALLIMSGVASSDEFSKTKLTHIDVYKSVPSLRNAWTSSMDWNGFRIYKQPKIFKMDDVQYRDIIMPNTSLKMEGYSIHNYTQSMQSEGFLSNKIRLMAGISPITIDDNQPLMLCKLENHVDGEYYEMSVTQYLTVRQAYPSNYAMEHLCTRGEHMGAYWKLRLSDYYDEYGNKK